MKWKLLRWEERNGIVGVNLKKEKINFKKGGEIIKNGEGFIKLNGKGVNLKEWNLLIGRSNIWKGGVNIKKGERVNGWGVDY